jgi:hypothetical protein
MDAAAVLRARRAGGDTVRRQAPHRHRHSGGRGAEHPRRRNRKRRRGALLPQAHGPCDSGKQADRRSECPRRRGSTSLPCGQLILAVGHSARDTFEMLHSMGVPMEPKAFSMGVRIEHLPDRRRPCPVRPGARGGLPPADYALNVRLPDGESAYTFCMCPAERCSPPPPRPGAW